MTVIINQIHITLRYEFCYNISEETLSNFIIINKNHCYNKIFPN